MHCKLHQTQNSSILACCDEGLLGKNLVDKGHDVTILEAFYGCEKTDGKEAAALLMEADSINLFGERSIALAMKEGLITERDVIRIGGVPHAVILRI